MKKEIEVYFSNLYENKVIFHERFLVLCELVNLNLDEMGFKAELKVIRLLNVEKKFEDDIFQYLTRTPTFKVGSTYESHGDKILNNKRIGRPYCPYTIWAGPEFVERVCKMSEKELEENIWGSFYD